MSFVKMMSWDNRKRPVRLDPKTGRSWTRKIEQYENEHDQIKMKFYDGEAYKEVLTDESAAKTMWKRFKEGQTIEDTISVLGTTVPKALESRRQSEAKKKETKMAKKKDTAKFLVGRAPIVETVIAEQTEALKEWMGDREISHYEICEMLARVAEGDVSELEKCDEAGVGHPKEADPYKEAVKLYRELSDKLFKSEVK